MASQEGVGDEAERLYHLLAEADLTKRDLLDGFDAWSPESRNAVVERVARSFSPPPRATLLARLLEIRTPANEEAMGAAFVLSLRSPDPKARRISLFGLGRLGHRDLDQFALAALRDDHDPVTATAIELLLPRAKGDRRLWAVLEGFYASRQADEGFHMSLSLLEANGIPAPMPLGGSA